MFKSSVSYSSFAFVRVSRASLRDSIVSFSVEICSFSWRDSCCLLGRGHSDEKTWSWMHCKAEFVSHAARSTSASSSSGISSAPSRTYISVYPQ